MKDKKLNELQMLLLCIRTALEEKVITEKLGKPGIKFNAGTPIETRMRWRRALGLVTALDNNFSYKGSNTIGICKDCVNFDTKGMTTKTFGYCAGKMVHKYDSCGKYEGVE